MHLVLKNKLNRFLEDVKYEDYQEYLSPELFEKLIDLDPTKKSYQSWILKTFINEFKPFLVKNTNLNPEKIPEIKKFLTEDSYKVTEDLEKFDKLKRKNLIPRDKKDIMIFKTFVELWNFLSQYSDVDLTDKKIEPHEAEKIFENNEWLVVIPKTYKASCKYGANTRWCTAARDSKKYFDHYFYYGPLFIIINKNNNKKFQLHFESESWMDEKDKPINLPSFLDQLPWELKFSIYQKTKKFELDLFLSLFSDKSKQIILSNTVPILPLLKNEAGQANLQKIIEVEIDFLYRNEDSNIFNSYFFETDIFNDILDKFPLLLENEKMPEVKGLLEDLDYSVEQFILKARATYLDLYLSKKTYYEIVDRLAEEYDWDITSPILQYTNYNNQIIYLFDWYNKGYITEDEYDEMYRYIYDNIFLKEILKGQEGDIPYSNYFREQGIEIGLLLFAQYYAKEYAKQYIGDNAVLKKIANYIEEKMKRDEDFNKNILSSLNLKNQYQENIKQLDEEYNFLTPQEKKVLEIKK